MGNSLHQNEDQNHESDRKQALTFYKGEHKMKKQPNSSVKAHLLRGAFYLLLLMAVCVIPFALGQRATTKQSAFADPFLFGLASVAALPNSDEPASGTWTPTGSLNTARYYHTATLLPNGKVLVSGGWDGFNPFTSAELYDPASGMWSITGSLNTARELHTATLLPNGKVLVAGGRDSSGQPSVSAELYDLALGTWTPTGALIPHALFTRRPCCPTARSLLQRDLIT
jgi:hypothetical protein